jgi:hypothetical protein
MNREVHVRFWESPEVKVLRATRQLRRSDHCRSVSGHTPIAPELKCRRKAATGKEVHDK